MFLIQVGQKIEYFLFFYWRNGAVLITNAISGTDHAQAAVRIGLAALHASLVRIGARNTLVAHSALEVGYTPTRASDRRDGAKGRTRMTVRTFCAQFPTS